MEGKAARSCESAYALSDQLSKRSAAIDGPVCSKERTSLSKSKEEGFVQRWAPLWDIAAPEMSPYTARLRSDSLGHCRTAWAKASWEMPRGCFASITHRIASTVSASMRPRGVLRETAVMNPSSAGALWRSTRRNRIFCATTDQSLDTSAQDARVCLLSLAELPLA